MAIHRVFSSSRCWAGTDSMEGWMMRRALGSKPSPRGWQPASMSARNAATSAAESLPGPPPAGNHRGYGPTERRRAGTKGETHTSLTIANPCSSVQRPRMSARQGMPAMVEIASAW